MTESSRNVALEWHNKVREALNNNKIPKWQKPMPNIEPLVFFFIKYLKIQ